MAFSSHSKVSTLKNCWSVLKFEDLSSCTFIRQVTPQIFSLSRPLEISRQYLLLRTVILEKKKSLDAPNDHHSDTTKYVFDSRLQLRQVMERREALGTMMSF